MDNRYRGGMQVTEIRKDGPAAKAGLRLDDVIVGIARWETTSAESTVFALNQPSNGKVFVRRDGQTVYTRLPLGG